MFDCYIGADIQKGNTKYQIFSKEKLGVVKNAVEPQPYCSSSSSWICFRVMTNSGIKKTATGPRSQPSSLSVLPPWCPDGIYQAIALVHHDGAPVLHAQIH